MSSSLPLWVQYAQALSTPAIAILAVVIGIMQWRTAHQRAVLDLFDRRFAMYQNIRKQIATMITSGKASNDIHFEFMRAYDGAEFLFGEEVLIFLKKIDSAIGDFHVADAESEELQGDRKRETLAARRKHFSIIESFYTEFGKLLLPYVRMHQKAPWI